MTGLFGFILPILLIEPVGALYIVGYATAAVVVLIRSRDTALARLLSLTVQSPV
ncbi:MAG: hypothetical protein IVW55_01695 [Chloroflexi bacterium]|nr:hypothetical protein [Chloroflexota bacterium]